MREYSYASDGSLLSEKTLRWDNDARCWVNLSVLTYNYERLTNTVTINYASWNKAENRFDASSQKAVYQYLSKDLLSGYTQYEKETSNGDWEITTHFSMNNYFISQLYK